MGLENFIQSIQESIKINEEENRGTFLRKAAESFKNKLAETTSLKDLTVNLFAEQTKNSLASGARLTSPSLGLSLDLTLYITKMLEDNFPLIYMVVSSSDLHYVNKRNKPGSLTREAAFTIKATYNSQTSTLEKFEFSNGDVGSFEVAMGLSKERVSSMGSKSFYINLNYNRETNDYNLSLLDNRSSVKTDLVGITQELRKLEVPRIENIIELAKSKGVVKFVVSPGKLQKSGISFN